MLFKQGIDFWDSGTRNLGRVPLKLPHFPEGVTVVVDRLAVKKLSSGAAVIQTILRMLTEGKGSPVWQKTGDEFQEALTALNNLYEPLRQAFKETWTNPSLPPDAGKMRHFLNLCADYAQTGKLVAGWNEADYARDNSKAWGAQNAAKHYESRLNAVTLSSPAAAVPQSPRQPA